MIQLFQVGKTYPGEAPALEDVTLHVRKGELAFVTGPSGAGKSTLLRLVLCAERPTSGQILVFGRNLGKVRASSIPFIRRSMGVVFQDFKLLPERTVAENVAFPLVVRGVPAREVEQRVAGMLRSVGLEGKGERFPRALSGGEQQRVSIARALAGEPALVLADEPTGNLDQERTLEVMELLRAANARGTTVLVATHDRMLLRRYASRVIVLERGRVVLDDGQARSVVPA